MLENMVMECIKYIVITFTIVLLLFVFNFFIILNSANEYKQFVNYQIEKYGGVTDEAEIAIEKYNTTYTNGRFTLKANVKERVDFGEEVHYQVKTDVTAPFISQKIKIEMNGTAISMVK